MQNQIRPSTQAMVDQGIISGKLTAVEILANMLTSGQSALVRRARKNIADADKLTPSMKLAELVDAEIARRKNSAQ